MCRAEGRNIGALLCSGPVSASIGVQGVLRSLFTDCCRLLHAHEGKAFALPVERALVWNQGADRYRTGDDDMSEASSAYGCEMLFASVGVRVSERERATGGPENYFSSSVQRIHCRCPRLWREIARST